MTKRLLRAIRQVPTLILVLGYLFFSTALLASSNDEATNGHHDHNSHHHSDILLLLIADKLAIKKLQKAFNEVDSNSQQQHNLNEQKLRLNRSLQRLRDFSATPEGYYANLELYQQSLENRANMLVDFAQLLHTHHQQHDLGQIGQ
ncbi:hypothetical protein HF888_06045 [Bermanella marisrubri]|uniref:hypothetical protein n=1 Tax=Bermanella marisrubri TaxID=207949 RepID=UPI001442ACCC|nr:hypothetical protein [Bermanella marisrubri]QIZ83809.1 hypothetical protein HF888_06045 [Bermanella marisrubri]